MVNEPPFPVLGSPNSSSETALQIFSSGNFPPFSVMILNCIERSKFSNELRKIRKAEETGKGRGRGQYIFLALFYYSWGVRKFRSFYGVLIFLTRIPTILGPIRSFDPRPISRESINLSIQGKHTFSYVLSFVQSTCFYWSQFPIRKSSLSINLP